MDGRYNCRVYDKRCAMTTAATVTTAVSVSTLSTVICIWKQLSALIKTAVLWLLLYHDNGYLYMTIIGMCIYKEISEYEYSCVMTTSEYPLM